LENFTGTRWQGLAISDLELASKNEWQSYIFVALTTSPELVSARSQELSEKLKVGKESIMRRIMAIHYAMSTLRYTGSQVRDAGQEATLSAYIKSRKAENAGKTVKLGYQVSFEVKQMFDEQMARIRDIANIPTPEQFWDWAVSHLRDLTDEQIRHSAGGKGAA